MTAAFTEPVVHNSPDRWDALAFMCAGVAIYLIIRALIWVARRGESFWAAREAEAAKAGKRTETWAAAWGGSHEDVARVERELAAGEYRAKLTTPKPVKSGRLAAVKRGAK